MIDKIRKILKSTLGQGLVEYALITALVSVAGLAGLTLLGGNIKDSLSASADKLSGDIGGRTVITATWSNTEFDYDGVEHAPNVSISGLKDGDAAAAAVEGAAKSIGEHTARVVLSFTSGNAEDYVIENETCKYRISGEAPTLVAGQILSALKSAYSPVKNDSIAVTEIKLSHTPNGTELAEIPLGKDGSDQVMGYIYSNTAASDGSTRFKLVIAGNGSDKIKCNANSYGAFDDLANNYNGGNGNIIGLENLDVTGVTNAKYMFAENEFGDISFPALDLSNAENLNLTFYKISGRNVSFANTIYAPLATQAVGMFQNLNVSGTFNISGLNTSKLENVQSMFASANVDTLNLNTFNMSNCKIFKQMFTGSTINTLKINSWNVEKAQDFTQMFAAMHGPETINISGWNPKSVTTTNMMFGTTGDGYPKYIYCATNWASCSDFNGMFQGYNNAGQKYGVQKVYAASDFVTSSATGSAAPFNGNPNFKNGTGTTVADLKLTQNGGLIYYSAGMSD